MSGLEMRQARKGRGWTQNDLARKLGVSQGYMSLLEHGSRRVPRSLAHKLVSSLGLPPDALPVNPETGPLPSDRLAAALASLGYPKFSYLRRRVRLNPAELMARALRSKSLEARVVEALPWVLVRYPDVDWQWLLQEAKQHDFQNRLGFVVTFAKELAARHRESAVVVKLEEVERSLADARLLKEDAFAGDALTDAERRWLRTNRTPEAAYWNVLTNLSVEALNDDSRRLA